MERREFLKTVAGATAGVLVASCGVEGQKAERDRLGALLPKRLLGRTGERVTMLGVGGWHIGGSMDEAEAQAVVEAALAGGIRFFDTAESYQRGESESRYGRLLTPKYRDDVFLMTKSTAKDGKTAREHLEGSLARLKTDRVDLWQMHTVQDAGDVDRRVAQGVVDVMVKAKEEGKARHIGFTGHRATEAHLRVLESVDVFETCQMPINCLDPSSSDSFIERVLPTLTARSYGVLAMKTLANGNFFGTKEEGVPPLVPDRVSVREAIQFVWSLPVSVLITGPDNVDQMREKMAFAREFVALDEEARGRLIEKVADLAGPAVEYYKA